jgi:hypothetical protein
VSNETRIICGFRSKICAEKVIATLHSAEMAKNTKLGERENVCTVQAIYLIQGRAVRRAADTVLFAMVLISRINSWESWFIFNLQRK